MFFEIGPFPWFPVYRLEFAAQTWLASSSPLVFLSKFVRVGFSSCRLLPGALSRWRIWQRFRLRRGGLCGSLRRLCVSVSTKLLAAVL